MNRAALLIALAACGNGPSSAAPPIRFLHTFAANETELFNATMAERGLAVESSLVPFARGQQIIGEILRAQKGCPDLIRIDATWLPGLVRQGLLTPVPAELRALDWLPEVAATDGVPQTIDGLVVVRDQAAPAPKDDSVAQLVEAARAARHADRPHPLGLRADGYWLVPWLRAHGSDLRPVAPGDGAVLALSAFAQLFGDLADSPPASGAEAPEELRRWLAHDVAYWVTGPWQIGALTDRERLAISELHGAPRGGQMLVVPKCAGNPSGGWKLATELTSVDVATRFADAFAIVPTRASALAKAPQLVRDTYAALRTAEPLAPDPLTPLLFDDLNPAIAAVIAGDASAVEAIEGVRRGWDRLVRRERDGAKP
jgi:ABC-type glycerol-3-phosphate transport system substrate-binding protein